MATQFANYILEKKISENGPVTVHLARHKVLNRHTLLKIYSGADATLVKRFEEEARIVAEIDDPGVVAIYDYGTVDDSTFYIAMEYMDGGNLYEHLRDNALSKDQVLQLCRQIGECIAVIHRKGYVHRDLKPENLLINSAGQVKLTDFGISFQVSQKRTTPKETLLGTPLYMSPEQINNAATGPHSDVFSMGIIFYQIASGDHPFEAESVGEIFSNILSKKIKPLSEWDYPGWFSDLVAEMLTREAVGRPESAEEVVTRFPGNVKNSPPKVDEPGFPVEKSASRGRLILPALLLLVISLVFYFWPEDNQNQSSGNLSNIDSGIAKSQPADSTINETAPPPVSVDKDSAPQDKPEPTVKNDEPPAQHTRLYIQTKPWCKIYLNYEYFDTHPMTDTIKINPGKYTIGLQNPGYPTWVEEIEIVRGRDNFFSFNLDSIFYKMELDVHPYGEVYIDDKLIGTTPFAKPLVLNKNNRVLRIENNYYETYYDSLNWNGEPLISKKVVLGDKKQN